MTEILGVTVENWTVFFIILLVSAVLARAVYIYIRYFFDQRLTKRASKNIARMAEYIIICAGMTYGIFNVLQLNLTAIAASLGLAGIAVAFASQQIIQNFIAGLIIGVERRIQLEDWIEIVGSTTAYKTARVRDITLTKTILLDASGHLVHVPNSVIINSQVINYTQAGFFEVPIEIRIDRKDDMDRVTSIVREVAEKEKDILPNPHVEGNRDLELLFEFIKTKLKVSQTDMTMFNPRVLISRIDGDDLVLSIRIWIMDPPRRDDIVSKFLQNLNTECSKAGIKFNHS